MVFRLELTRQILSVESIKLPPDSQNGQIDFYQTARDSKGTNIKQSEWNGGTDDFKITCLLILPFIMIKHFNPSIGPWRPGDPGRPWTRKKNSKTVSYKM